MERLRKKMALSIPPRSPLPPNDENYSFSKEAPAAENEQKTGNQLPQGRALDPTMDPKKLRRVMASRQYSQKYRLKQLHYILHLETEVKALQAEVAIASPRIKYVDRQNSLLRVENGSMKQRLSAFSSELMFKEAQYEELKNERDIMKQLFLMNQPDFFDTKAAGNFYQFANVNFNRSSNFNPFIDQPLPPSAAGASKTSINYQKLN